MANQGQYPLNGRTLSGTDTVTGVCQGATADIPLTTLTQFISGGAAAGPTSSRPATPSFVGQFFFDTTLGQPIWVTQLTPTVIWVNAAGVSV